MGRCSQLHKSCSCTNHFILPKYFDLTSTNKSNSPLCIHSADFGWDSLHIFCRRSSMSNIHKLKTFRQRGKVQSLHSLTDVVVDCSPVAQSDMVLSPSARWIFDSMEATLKTRSLIKSSVVFQSVPQNAEMKQIMLRDIESGDPGILSGRKKSELDISQEMSFSCSSSKSTPTHLSNSPVVFNSALIQCIWESGKPYFLFAMNKVDNLYTTSPHKIKSSVDKALDYIYVFHAWKDKSKKPKNLVCNVPNFVGKMEVRSSVVLNSGRCKYLETEFVLSAPNDGSPTEMKSLPPSIMRSKGPYSKISKIFRRNHLSKIDSIEIVGASRSQYEDPPEFNLSDHLGIAHKVGCPNLELAAIVVQDFGFQSKHGASSGGWGLKFLEKPEADDADSCQGSPSTSVLCSQNFIQHKNSDRHVNVLVPAGIHGGVMTGNSGPSSLIERWRSNGHCDCGGWDVGCALTVLNNNSKDLPQGSSQEKSKSLNLSIAGAKHGEPAFSMFSVSKDIHIINFQSTLSPLQSFSTGVALIHSQNPNLYSQW
ncbi:hypothetical protein Cni_G18701 [Canna indica]|uniref:Uncharacterized protein n=1 Tax=Canna indica TaxID=4628 RepID=A0AAQ3KPS6_9LILI|nr:hypothetical protein Cni_G18701 [Canna indica]